MSSSGENADPIWLHRNGMWDYMEAEPSEWSEDGEAMELF